MSEKHKEKLPRSLAEALHKIHQQAVTIAENTKASRQTKETQPPAQLERISAIVDLIPEVTNRYYSEQDKTYRLGKKTFWVTILTLIALVAYTMETHIANSLARRSLEISQRAYVTYGSAQKTATGIKVRINNVGHVPTQISTITSWLDRLDHSSAQFLERSSRTAAPDHMTVSPGTESDAVILFEFATKDQASIDSGDQRIVITADLKYTTGFDGFDDLYIRVTYDPETKQWVHVNSGALVSFVHEQNGQK